MADAFVGEIRIFAFDYAPAGWAFCDGQVLPASQNTALCAVLGSLYGGDGESTFALPNLQGGAALHRGQGPGLSARATGAHSGSPGVTLTGSQIAAHTHSIRVTSEIADVGNPSPSRSLARSFGGSLYHTDTTHNLAPMAVEQIGPSGEGQAHSNMQPFLTVNFCIALQGVNPPRS